MIIGIDLDNTIANLDPVFGKVATKMGLGNFEGCGKHAVKFALTKEDGSDLLWQKLQGQVYGAEYHQASVYPHAAETILKWCNSANIEVSIVSHKTRYGHQDEGGVVLHDAAMSWLMAGGIVGNSAILPENVYFEVTQEKKLERILSLNCDVFIDDLVAILDHAQFPFKTEGLLFSPHDNIERNKKDRIMQSWFEINAFIDMKLSAIKKSKELPNGTY